MNKTGICCICGKEYTMYGSSPDPLTNDENARCCRACDWMYVIPARQGVRLSLQEAKYMASLKALYDQLEQLNGEPA